MAAADYWSQAQLDPAYMAAHGGNRQSIINALLGYGDASSAFARPTGIDPATGQPYKSLAENYNFGEGDVGAAAGNPYSVQANLAQTLSGNRYAIGNTAAAHGATFSGANAAAQAGETLHAGQRNYNAQQQLASQLAGIGQQDTSALTGAYTNIANQALNTPVPQAPAAPEAAPVTYLPGGGVPGSTPSPAAGPGPREFIPPKIKLPALPKPKQATGYQGHA